MPFTDPNAYGSSWYAATAAASPARPRLNVELDVDVCVIGGGLAGLTAAREVARRGWSVVVLEAHSVAWNASGRNSGFVLPGYAADAAALVSRVGLDHARRLWALSEAGAEYVRATAAGMPGVELSEGGWLRVSKTDRDGAMQSKADLLAGKFGAAVEAWSAERVREALRSPIYFGALHHPRGFSIHPLNYALGLAAAAEACGARIHEDTAAIEVDPAGVRKRIVTKDARVRAAHVVLAGSAHMSALMPQLANTLLPVHSYVMITAPLGAALSDAIRFPGGVSDTDLADSHYRVVDGDRLIWTGRSTVWRGRPQRYVDALLGDIARTYPQLRSVKAEFAWTGMLGNTVHGMPLIGEVSPGLWMLSGFGSHGLNTTAMGGEILARAIVDGDRTWKLFEPFEMVWAGGMFGRAAQQFHYWSSRGHKAVESWFSHQRDAKRRREQDAQAASAAAAVESPVAAMVPPVTPAGEPVPASPLPAMAAEEAAFAAPPPEAPATVDEQTSIVPDAQPGTEELPAREMPAKRRRRRGRKARARRRQEHDATLAPAPGADSDAVPLKERAPNDESPAGGNA